MFAQTSPDRRPECAWAWRALPPIALVLLSLLACVIASAAQPAPAQAAAAKGVVDWQLEMPEGIADPSIIPGLVDEFGPDKLNAGWTRVYFRWARLQPTRPVSGSSAQARNAYDETYLVELDQVIEAFRAEDVKVILTGTDVPEWASDSRYWAGHPNHSDVVPAIGKTFVRTAWQDLARLLAARYKGKGAEHFEVWNEPNLSSGLYPQLVGRKKTPVGPAVYLKMLNLFYAAAHQGNRNAVVIAGATSRRGSNDLKSTAPQWFAAYLRDHRARLDAYSHHPYSVPGSSPSPSAPPRNVKRTVTLGNIGVLLKIFPKKKFYLTEYGLSTDDRDLFCAVVSPEKQKQYLQDAYAYVSRRPQIKVLLWFLLKDYVQNTDGDGVYSGLIDSQGVHKPAWDAFAAVPR